MTPQQTQAFTQAAGFSADTLTFVIRLAVGGFAIVAAVMILMGLMHYLNTASGYDKVVFVMCLFTLMFVLTLIFAYAA